MATYIIVTEPSGIRKVDIHSQHALMKKETQELAAPLIIINHIPDKNTLQSSATKSSDKCDHA